MLGAEPLARSIDIAPLNSQAKLRSLNISTISGAELHTLARQRYSERAKRVPTSANMNAQQLEQLAVHPADFAAPPTVHGALRM